MFILFRFKQKLNELECNRIIEWLDKDSKPFVEQKEDEPGYIYIQDKEIFGALNVIFKDDWIIIREFFYQDLVTLQSLMAFVSKQYPAKGIHVRTYSCNVKEDLNKLGFSLECSISSLTDHDDYMYLDYTYQTQITPLVDCLFTMTPKKFLKELITSKNAELSKGYKVPEYIKEVEISAYDGDDFIGGIKGQLYKNSLHISLLAVDERYRGQKVGFKLMMIAEDIAKENHIPTLDLSTTEYQARAFYESLGYQVVYTRQDYPIGYENYKLIKNI